MVGAFHTALGYLVALSASSRVTSYHSFTLPRRWCLWIEYFPITHAIRALVIGRSEYILYRLPFGVIFACFSM